MKKLILSLFAVVAFFIAPAQKTSNSNYISGSGTVNYIPKFTGSKKIGNSIINQTTSMIGVGVIPTSLFHVKFIGHSSSNIGLKLTDDLSSDLFTISETGRVSINGASNSSKYGVDDAILASKNSGYTFQHAASTLWLFDNNQQFEVGLQGSYVFLGTDSNHDLSFRANGSNKMTIKTTGVVNLNSIPTSTVGLSTGDIWSDSGTLKIVP